MKPITSRQFHDQEALRVLGDAGGDLLAGGGFVAFIGADFDFEATVDVGRGGAEGGEGHGGLG
jgi:hypothetical protein